jgi:hypothetical protein
MGRSIKDKNMNQKHGVIKTHNFAIQYPEIRTGSIWEVTTRRHKGQRRVVVGFNSQRTSVYVRIVGKALKQHSGQIYTVDAGIFLRGHLKIS